MRGERATTRGCPFSPNSAKPRPVTGFDLFVLGVMAFSALLGWHRGGLREIVTLIAIAAGFVAIGLLGAALSATADGTLMRLVILAALFLAGYLAVFVAGGALIRSLIGPDKRREDRWAGGLFGALRGWILAAFVFYTVSVYHTGAPLPRSVSDSLLAPPLASTVRVFLRNAEMHVTDLSKACPRAISTLPV